MAARGYDGSYCGVHPATALDATQKAGRDVTVTADGGYVVGDNKYSAPPSTTAADTPASPIASRPQRLPRVQRGGDRRPTLTQPAALQGPVWLSPSSRPTPGLAWPKVEEMAALVVRHGTHIETVPLVGAEVSLGRDPTNAVALPADEAVSKFHARLILENETWSVYDAGSTNGTYVNETRTDYQRLAPGDEITLGATRLTFLADTKPADEYLDADEEWEGPTTTHHTTGQPSPAPIRGRQSIDAVPPGSDRPEPVAPPGRIGAGTVFVTGIARNVQVRQETNNQFPAMVLRVDVYDSRGNRLPAVSVHVDKFRRGHVSEGEEVEVHGTWKRGTLHARSMKNLTTGAEIVSGMHGGEKIAVAIFLTIFATVFLVIAGVIAVSVILAATGRG